MSHERCFLLWRRDSRVVATVCPTPNGEAGSVVFRGHACERLDPTGFYDHFLTPAAATRTQHKKIVGFSLYLSDPHKAMLDMTKADNVVHAYTKDGLPWGFEVVLETSHSYEDDGAQGFFLEAFVSPDGATILAVPEWDESLAVGFEIVSEDAPAVAVDVH